MIKIGKISSLLVLVLFLNSCACNYKNINPATLNYASKSADNNILLEYKYELLEKKYKRKEANSGMKLIAVKITNYNEKDIVLGRDFMLTKDNGDVINLISSNQIFKTLKQSPASHLFYLLLAPIQFYTGTTTTSNGYYTQTKPANPFPIGLIAGPTIAGGNMIAASSANKKFKSELNEFDINKKIIKKGETVFGLIGIESEGFEGIKIKMIQEELPNNKI